MNINTVVDPGMPGAVFPWVPSPSATDNLDTINPANIICKDNSGKIVTSATQYPASVTTVTCRVNDTQQNEGSCVFSITVSGTCFLSKC